MPDVTISPEGRGPHPKRPSLGLPQRSRGGQRRARRGRAGQGPAQGAAGLRALQRSVGDRAAAVDARGHDAPTLETWRARLDAAICLSRVARPSMRPPTAGPRRSGSPAGAHRRSLRRLPRAAGARPGRRSAAAGPDAPARRAPAAGGHPGPERPARAAARGARAGGHRAARHGARRRSRFAKGGSGMSSIRTAARRPGCFSTSARTAWRPPATPGAARSTPSATTGALRWPWRPCAAK